MSNICLVMDTEFNKFAAQIISCLKVEDLKLSLRIKVVQNK